MRSVAAPSSTPSDKSCRDKSRRPASPPRDRARWRRGCTAAEAALTEADGRLKAADAALLALDRQRDAALKSEKDGVYAKAIEILAEADSRESISKLYYKATQTMSQQDDAIVRRIEAGDKTIAAAGRKRTDLIARAQVLAQRRSEIEAQRAQFYRRGYDNPMGQFSNEQAISNVLGGILQGVVQGAVLGQVLQGGYNERARRADSGFGGGGGFNFPGGFGGGMGGGGGWIRGGGGRVWGRRRRRRRRVQDRRGF